VLSTNLGREPANKAALMAAILRSDLYSLVQASFPIVSGGGGFLSNWHIDAMCHELSQVIEGKTRRLIITVPPRSLKSICASVCLPAFFLGHDPARRIICVSYSEALARKHANDCRALMRSESLPRRIPRDPDKSRQGYRDGGHDHRPRLAACDFGRWYLDRSRRQFSHH
jgi:hypothetical protein